MASTGTGAATGHSRATHSRTRDTKRIVAYVIVALVAAWLIAFIVANSEHVKVSFVFGEVSLSLIWVMIICAVLGALLTFAISRLSRRR
jgi:uncharacterized integral membrane protein